MPDTPNWWQTDPVVAKAPPSADGWWHSDPVVSKPSPITTSGLVRAAAEGIPVVGGLLNKANAATYAGLAPLFPGDETVSHASSFGERYRENLSREEARSS
jgi:hypothetical protein